MNFFTRLSTQAFVGRGSRVRLTSRQWSDLIAELGRRAGGTREAGAFLLASSEAHWPSVVRVVFFDDVDPACLTGGISLSSSAFSRLWSMCAAEGLRVIADVHTHPGPEVGQSHIDRDNPLIAKAGHVAVIVPDLAGRTIAPFECGVHVYLGGHRWRATFQKAAKRSLYVGRWA